MILSERQLMAVCITLSIVGIAVLFLISAVTEPPRAALADVDEMSSGKVTVSGFVMDYSDKGNYAVLELAGTESTEAVSFDAESVRKLGLRKFQDVKITGDVRKFRGRSSIIISKIKTTNRSLGCGN
ncbi:TPA: hypothetical protein HA231_04080 [Candidatus Woesearchaeota archaeon]|nr:hypothetical protein [Candidatus Woesearchaeota archaeon]